MWEMNKKDAIKMHKKFFKGNFTIAPFEYSSLVDVRPWTLFYPMSLKKLQGNWTGFICSDGKKIVISKLSRQYDLKETWVINKSELIKIEIEEFHKLTFTKKFKGLTNYNLLDTWILFCLSFSFLPLMIFWYSRKTVICRIHNDYLNKVEMVKILLKMSS